VIPSITEESLGDANLIAGALEVSWIAAHGFVVTIWAIGCSIADETLLDAFTRVAAVRTQNWNFDQQKWKRRILPKLINTASGAVELVAFVWTVILSITSPRRGDAVSVVVNGEAVAVERRRASEVIRPASWKRSAVLAIFQEHQSLWTRAHLIGLAVVHGCDANVRTFVLRRHAEMILDDFRFRMPHSHDIGDVGIFFL
jgi:hypothetical protein